MFGDYKAYKKYAPQYAEWKGARDLAEAKRQEFLHLNPKEINKDDIQKSKALLRAIDIMDEFSQNYYDQKEGGILNKRIKSSDIIRNLYVIYFSLFVSKAVGLFLILLDKI